MVFGQLFLKNTCLIFHVLTWFGTSWLIHQLNFINVLEHSIFIKIFVILWTWSIVQIGNPFPVVLIQKGWHPTWNIIFFSKQSEKLYWVDITHGLTFLSSFEWLTTFHNVYHGSKSTFFIIIIIPSDKLAWPQSFVQFL